MEVIKTKIDGVVIIEPRVFKDARGYFFGKRSVKAYCRYKTIIMHTMKYLINHYDELTAYLSIAEMPVDNNDTERAIREMVMGKKNYLFCENELSCYNAAEMYSFFGACKVLGKNPERWLTFALKHVNTYQEERLEELLPENWVDFK